MRIFLSYPSAEHALAERLFLALRAEGHEVFFDRTSLPPGEPFDARIRDDLARSEVLIYLVTPDSVTPGSYALAELGMARQRWELPAGHVLPVMVRPTPLRDVPPYLRAVTMLELRGDPVAEILCAVSVLALRRHRSWPAWVALLDVALVTVVAGVLWVHRVRSGELPLAEPSTAEQGLPLPLPAGHDAMLGSRCPYAAAPLETILTEIRRSVRARRFDEAVECEYPLHAASVEDVEMAVYPDLLLAHDQLGQSESVRALAAELAAASERGHGYLASATARRFVGDRLAIVRTLFIHAQSVEMAQSAQHTLEEGR